LREESRGENRKSVVHESMTKNLISGTSYACGNMTKSGEKKLVPLLLLLGPHVSVNLKKKIKKKSVEVFPCCQPTLPPKPPKVGKKKRRSDENETSRNSPKKSCMGCEAHAVFYQTFPLPKKHPPTDNPNGGGSSGFSKGHNLATSNSLTHLLVEGLLG